MIIIPSLKILEQLLMMNDDGFFYICKNNNEIRIQDFI